MQSDLIELVGKQRLIVVEQRIERHVRHSHVSAMGRDAPCLSIGKGAFCYHNVFRVVLRGSDDVSNFAQVSNLSCDIFRNWHRIQEQHRPGCESDESSHTKRAERRARMPCLSNDAIDATSFFLDELGWRDGSSPPHVIRYYATPRMPGGGMFPRGCPSVMSLVHIAKDAMSHCESQLSHEVTSNTLVDPREQLAESFSIGRGRARVLAYALGKPVQFIEVAWRLGAKCGLHVR